MNRWRLLETASCSPFRNMAVDEALFEGYRVRPEPVLRIYGWKPAAFSIGYSQDAGAVLDVPASKEAGIPFVRRITGGGIIYHADEVTYCLVCSDTDIGVPSSIKEGYRILCSFLLETYRRMGLTPSFAVDAGRKESARSTFCFSSFEDYDIVVDGRKIGGNAQKRRRNLVLQHGSIPLSLDIAAISRYVKEPLAQAGRKSASLADLVGAPVAFEALARILKDSFSSVFSAHLAADGLNAQEAEAAERLQRQKYGTDAWNLHRKAGNEAA